MTQPVLKGSCILSAQDIANKIRGHGGASLGLRVQCASFCFPKSQDHCYEPRSLPQAYFKASSAFLPLQYLTQSVYSDTIQRRKIWAISLTYTTALGNTGSPTQWARPGIEPESSWILAGFGSAVPQWELPETQVYILLDSHSYSFSLGMHSCSYSPSLSQKKKKKEKRKKKKGFPSWLSVLWPTSMRTQVWALSLSSGLRIQRCHELCCRSQMWLWSCIAVAVVWAGRYSSNLTPSLRTSICCEYGPGKKEKTTHKCIYILSV